MTRNSDYWRSLAALFDSERQNIDQICIASGVAGASIVVLDHGKRVFEHNPGYRTLDTWDPVTADTVFPIGSLTKAFTGACISRLATQNKLNIDDCISEFDEDKAENRHPDVASLGTIADLLGHRTGL